MSSKETIKNEYNHVCFKLEEKKKELEELRLDIFILNPKVKEVISEIEKLNEVKKVLEEQIND